MMRIGAIACALPDREVSNADLERENPSWQMARVAKRSGVLSRRIAAPDETAFDLSGKACDALLADSGLELDSIDAILYCTQSPDYLMPGNAHLLHRRLGLSDDVLVFDYTLACSGYVYGLAFADSFARTGLASEILLVTAETYSKYIHPQNRTTRTLFGDGAVVTHLSTARETGGRIVACKLGAHGAEFERSYIPGGGRRMPPSEETRVEESDPYGNVRTLENIHLDGMGVWEFVNSTIPRHLKAFLTEMSLTLDDIDLFVFHQASKMTLDSLARALAIGSERVFSNLEEVGNLSSASIPFALRAALEEGAIGSGDRVVLTGFGAGLSYGSALLEF
jgi:3-oxoacyl-[acyl-carrier-protein] synthase-3